MTKNAAFIDTLDETEYDVELIRTDDSFGNFSPENVDDYMPENIILASIRNGQITQAKEQALKYAFNWESFQNDLK